MLEWFKSRKRWQQVALIAGVVLTLVAAFSIPFAVVGAIRGGSNASPSPSQSPERIRTCSVADLAADARFGHLQAHVVNADTEEVLFDRDGDVPAAPGSVLKVLTSAAALQILSPEYQVMTRVVDSSVPGQMVLVGAGDLTLASTGANVYPDAGSLPGLAVESLEAYRAKHGQDPTTVVLDSTLFVGEDWHESWPVKEIPLGYMSKVTALQVDGDRDDPYADKSARTQDPVARAGERFATALGIPVTLTRGQAEEGAETLAMVASPTALRLVDKALVISDNTAAEMLARQLVIDQGLSPEFSSTHHAVVEGLKAYDLDTDGLKIIDGSGLSPKNEVAPSFMTSLFVQAHRGEGTLGLVLKSLPVNGKRGSLAYADRFAGENAAPDGSVVGKTGWITGAFTLSGLVYAEDGSTLAFAVYALGDVEANAKQAIDALVSGFYRCGNELSND